MRQDILQRLVRLGSASATRLSAGLPVTRQAVVKHLSVLEGAGVVHRERAGREVLFLIQSEPLREAGAWIAAISARWEQRLERLRAHVESEVPPTEGGDDRDRRRSRS